MERVAIQGIHGSYSEQAAIAQFGESVDIVECASFDGAFGALRSGLATHAVIPLRNSIVGEIRHIRSLIARYRPDIHETIDLPIAHVLAAVPGARKPDLTAVRSHSEALRQCSKFLQANPHLEQISGFDTASSIRSIIVGNLLDQAAICSQRAADIYGADVLQSDVADRKDNFTTFVVVTERRIGNSRGRRSKKGG